MQTQFWIKQHGLQGIILDSKNQVEGRTDYIHVIRYEIFKAVCDNYEIIKDIIENLETENKKLHAELATLKDRVQRSLDLRQIHHASTTPMNAYHAGMYNGMECVAACIESREPAYKDVEHKPDLPPKEGGT